MSRRLALALLLFLALLVLAAHLNLPGLVQRDRLQAVVARLGIWAPLAFWGIFVLSVSLAMPAIPFIVTGGALFGPLWGALVNIAAVITGASLAFFIGRRLGRQAVEARLGGRLKELDDGLAREGLWFMLFLRLVPIFPSNGVNYGAGLTRIRFRDYFLATAIGVVPGTALYTYLGYAAATASWVRVAIALTLLGLLALIPILLHRRRRRDAES